MNCQKGCSLLLFWRLRIHTLLNLLKVSNQFELFMLLVFNFPHSLYIFLQICFLMTVNVIGQRMNFLVIIHGCWLVAILVRRRRAAIAKIWPKYCIFLSIFMIYQYLLCVGIPPALCIGENFFYLRNPSNCHGKMRVVFTQCSRVVLSMSHTITWPDLTE